MDYGNISVGPKDKPFLFLNPEQGNKILYDFTDRNGDLYMLDHDFEGSISLPFSKPVDSESGKVLLDGKRVPHIVKNIKFMADLNVNMLGIRIRGRMTEYGQMGKLEISGFTDFDGNTMLPVELTVCTQERTTPRPEYREHEMVALLAAEEGIVLMENKESVLPLPQNAYLNVFGKGLYDFRVCAVGAGKINPRYVIDFREAVHQADGIRLNPELEDFYRCDEDFVPDDKTLKRAREKSDVGIFILTRASGENMDNSTDKGEFYLSDDEETLLQKICDVFPKRVVILNVGYPVAMDFVEKYKIQSVVYCGFGGMLAGTALLNVLCGKTNPSGRLTDSWVCRYEDLPSSDDFYDCCNEKERFNADATAWIDTVYREGIYVGYRYFQTFGKKAAYSFGHGLSYTTFEKRMCSARYDEENGLAVDVEVKNTGCRAGKEVVMLYVKKPAGRLEQPARELIEFEKTEMLAPGEAQEIKLGIPNKFMSSYDAEKAAYVMPPGEYCIYLGKEVESAEKIYTFVLTKEKEIKKVRNRMLPVTSLEEIKSGVKENIEALEPLRECGTYPYRLKGEKKRAEKKLAFADVQKDEALLPAYVESLSVEKLARLAICSGDGWGMEGVGEAGRLADIGDEGLPKMIVADGNSGVNMRIKNIGMPSGVTICASFNRRLAGAVGRVIGEEAKELGIALILAPAFNIHRNPLCGRWPEYFSEDPYLAGKMAAAYCRGLEETGVGGCYKHLMANNAEASRKRNQSILSERTIREIYGKAFEIALDEYQPVSVMTAYNAVNGAPTSADADLLLGLLRDEWDFDGFVMTDWGSYDTADIVEMENAGNTWITPGSGDDTYTSVLCRAAETGRLDIQRLRENVWYLLKALLKLERRKRKQL